MPVVCADWCMQLQRIDVTDRWKDLAVVPCSRKQVTDVPHSSGSEVKRNWLRNQLNNRVSDNLYVEIRIII
jgi:hypothetical protein